MTVEKDGSGRRRVRVEVEVPGPPEEVWQAVATGPGIASWFVPTTIETDEHGRPARVVSDFGPGMESVATITEWNPPGSFAAESADLGPDAPPVATEWSVEERGGGMCTVRVEHSLVASTGDWDKQLEAWESGWPDFFRILRLYLAHFPGQACASFQLQAMSSLPRAEAWSRLGQALGFAGVAAGEQLGSAAGAPPLRARVERRGEESYPEELLLRVDEPAPGVAHLFAMTMGEQTLLSLRIHFYGEQAESAAREHEPPWRQWLERLFPPADDAPEGSEPA